MLGYSDRLHVPQKARRIFLTSLATISSSWRIPLHEFELLCFVKSILFELNTNWICNNLLDWAVWCSGKAVHSNLCRPISSLSRETPLYYVVIDHDFHYGNSYGTSSYYKICASLNNLIIIDVLWISSIGVHLLSFQNIWIFQMSKSNILESGGWALTAGRCRFLSSPSPVECKSLRASLFPDADLSRSPSVEGQERVKLQPSAFGVCSRPDAWIPGQFYFTFAGCLKIILSRRSSYHPLPLSNLFCLVVLMWILRGSWKLCSSSALLTCSL